ncbi:DUF4197 domain-containing protein [Marinobacterium sediminicola]|uniref:DUF4197 domain-containing protein n=1 Tax=Marinobacterium sediminicola TaxID=518898 RepID=A0ABY1S2H5_9GAMM|nr:DUF4197 domain-containing protein [Marinobacterium sediminicola]ULG68469.1 DUF4197 domain-containing protein [Marinobacterium sediminicola]SMR76768.1 Protein of unknown function [Marinobacterium sediminicola]
MNTRVSIVTGLALSLTLLSPAQAGWDDPLKQGEKILQQQTSSESSSTAVPEGVDTATLAKGLKEALRVGGERAIDRLAANGGFANHADVRIPMPGMLESVGGLMRNYGLGAQVDAFEASMNSAAEQAISEATPIFMDTLENMTLDDARRIYSGGDTAATDYFRDKTHDPLSAKLKPLIEQAMASTGVIQAYQLLVSQAEEQVPMLQGMSPNLGNHVTEAALDGLFLRLAQEEKKIRENPVARTTDLLKTVFGS